MSSDGKIQMYIYLGMEQMGEYKATRIFIPGQILLFFTYFSYLYFIVISLVDFLAEFWDQILPFSETGFTILKALEMTA